jgi:hypothetical protein
MAMDSIGGNYCASIINFTSPKLTKTLKAALAQGMELANFTVCL